MISKTDFIQYCQHPCWLWLSKNQPESLPPIDDNLNQLFEDGRELETYAARRYQNLVAGSVPTNRGHAGLQCSFQWEDFECRADLLVLEEDGALHLIEIKSSTEAKPVHCLDLAFQKRVLEGNGLAVGRVSVMHVNKEYVRAGEIDPMQLLRLTDVTAEVAEISLDIEHRMRAAHTAATSSTMPDPSPRHCEKDFKKEWLGIARELAKLPESNVYEMPYLSLEAAAALEDQGIVSIVDIPAESLRRADQRAIQASLQLTEPAIDREAIRKALESLTYPLYFLDYESVSLSVPAYETTRPYQQVVFQYSLHKIPYAGATETHDEYLHTDKVLPIRKLTDQLRIDIGPSGSIVVWNATFEKSRNTEMGEMVPEAAAFYEDLNNRIFDLMRLFKPTSAYRDARFKGSASIKKVLPVLVPDLNYTDLVIQEGQSASRLWRNVVLDEIALDSTSSEVFADLIEYCKLDTLAMVRIFQELQKLSRKHSD